MQPIPPLPTLSDLLQQVGSITGLPAVILACACSFLAICVRDWRIAIAAFMGLFLSLSLLTATLLPPEWALLQVIVGGLIGIVWYLSAQRAGWGGSFLPFHRQGGVKARPLSSMTLFRVLLGLLMAVILLVVRPRLPLPPLPADIRLVVTWLAFFGILGLALGEEAMQVGVALLLWMGAVLLMLAALRQDAWLIWMLSTVELLLGLATAYLMVARGPEITSPPEGGSR